MATGYDNRQAGRASFAFAPQAARQTRNSEAPVQQGRNGVVGAGEARGGVVMSEAPAIGAGIGSGIPAFLEQVFEPVIQQASTERMYQGYAAAVDGMTMDQIAENKPALAGIFGQSDFEKGASFYHVQKGLANWQSEQLANMDALKRMDPNQVGKVLFDAATPFLTGDQATDNQVHRAVIEASQELLPRVAAARIEWRRGEQRKDVIELGTTRARNLQTLSDQQNAAEVEGDPELLASARLTFLESMRPLDNMSEEDWSTSVAQVARTVIANGNLAAYNAMAEGGENSLLFMALGATGDGEQYAAIQNLATQASRKALSDWGTDVRVTLANGTVVSPIDQLNARIATQEITGAAIRTSMESINELAMKQTGSTEPYYTEEEIAAAVGGYVRSVATEDRADRRVERQAAATEAARVATEQNKVAEIQRALSQRDPQAVIMSYGAGDVDNVMRSLWQTDPVRAIPILEGVFSTRGTTFSATAADVQNLVKANMIAGADSEGFQKALATWGSFTNPQARAFYFGDLDAQFLRYQTRTSGTMAVPALIAYSETFGAAGAAPGTATPGRRAEGQTGEDLTRAIQNMRPNWMMRVAGAVGPNPNSLTVLNEWVQPRAAELMRARPGMSTDDAVASALSGLKGNRELDSVGSYYWPTPNRTPSIETITGLTPDRLSAVFDDAIKDNMPNLVGVRQDSLRVIPRIDANGNGDWFVWGENEDGLPRGFSVTKSMLVERSRERLDEQRERARTGGWLTPPAINLPGVRGRFD